MKKILMLLSGFMFSFSSGQEKDNLTSKIVLVRHAEKINDGTKNPSLSETGLNRAKRLSELLSEVKIDEAYSTPYKRTTETLTPLCESKNISINSYNVEDIQFFIEKIKSGKTIIIAGHSNTIPYLVNALIKESKYQEINEDDYGKMWILIFKDNQIIDVTMLNY